ncbi:unnamed protein product [Rotaria sp. Silwood1]|nr:unnamed protein product [Rotaria sp. Silwood1]
MGNEQLKKTTSIRLTEKQIDMLKAATKFTEKDIREWHEYDLLGTSNRKGDRDPKILAAHIMTYLDVNGDNKVNRAEFIAGCKNNDSIRRLLVPNI